MTKIYVSPSTQPGNPYAVDGTNEAAVMRRVGNALVPRLKALALEVKLSPYTREGQYVNAARDSNAWGADLHLALHSDAGSPSRRGGHAIYFPGSVKGKRFAECIARPVAALTPWPDFGTNARGDLYELRATHAVASLIEVAFHDKRDSARWIIDHVDDIAAALAVGVADYLGLAATKVTTTKPAPTPSKTLRVRGPFALPRGHWYGPDDGTALSHSGKQARDVDAVREIQAEVGVEVDGVYGAATKAAVVVWQKAHGLKSDGLVGAITWAAMGGGR